MTDNIKVKEIVITKSTLNDTISLSVRDDTGKMDDIEKRARELYKMAKE